MKVRFNKGPWHRQVRDVHPSEVAHGQINVAVSTGNPLRANDYPTANGSITMIGHKLAIYRPVMVTVDLGYGPKTFPSVYPDGAICFEHKETI